MSKNEGEMLRLDNTKRSSFIKSPANYYLQYEQGIKPTKGSTALRYGIVWAAAMEGFYGHIAEHGWHQSDAFAAAVNAAKDKWNEYSEKQTFYDDYRTFENLGKGLLQYVDFFYQDEGMLEIIAPEVGFEILMEPSSDDLEKFPRLEPFIFMGKLDVDIRLDSMAWQMEHKTTGQNLQIQTRRIQRSPQLMGYDWAKRQIEDEPPEGSLVIIHHLSAYKSKKTLQWGKPKIDFTRFPLIFTPEDLEVWRQSLLWTAQAIQDSRRQDVWPCWLDNCNMYGGCSMSRVCEQGVVNGVTFPERDITGYFIDEIWDPIKDMDDEDRTIKVRQKDS